MKISKYLLLTGMAFHVLFAFPAHAAGVDVYLVYVGADKSVKNNIVSALPEQLVVKHYNASMLKMADYSGKQKVVTKLSKAKLVVFINGNEDPGNYWISASSATQYR